MSITNAELTAIRSDLNTLMDQTAVIVRETESTSSGWVSTTTSNVGTVSCLLAVANRQVMPEALADREGELNYYVLTVPHDTDLQTDDKVTIGSDEYAVRTLWDDHSHRISRRAIVAKVD